MWLELEQAAQLLGISSRTLLNNLSEYKCRQDQGRNGRTRTVIHIASLPPDIQLKYYEHHYQPANNPDLSGWEKLSEPSRQEALHRLELVRQAKDLIETNGRGDLKNQLTDLATKSGISLKTLYEYIAWHDRGRVEPATGRELLGIMALVPQYGRNRGAFLSIPQELQKWLEAQWLQPNRPSVAMVYIRLQQHCKEKNIACPSERTVNRYINTIPEAVRVNLRIGEKKFKDRFEPVIRRDISGLQPNDIWVGDHREHDVFIFTNAGHKEIKRVWLTAFWDLATAKWVGTYWSFGPSSRTIALSARNAIITHGLPKSVYIDNGKDYRSHYLNGGGRKIGKVDIDSETKGVFSALKIEVIRALPYNARSKPIERAFRLWSEQFDQHLPGWCGRDNKERPEKLKKEISEGKLLELAEFRDLAVQFIQRVESQPYGDRAPAAELWKDAQIVNVQPEILDMLLMQEQRRKVSSSGIWLFDLAYRSVELMQRVLVGQYVTVRYDPDDLSSIVVWDDKGRCIGRVPMDKRAAMQVGDIDLETVKEVQTMKRHNRQVINEYREQSRRAQEQDPHLNPYKEVAKLREKRDKDKIVERDIQRERDNVIKIYPADMQELASQIVEAESGQATELENVVPLIFNKAVGHDVTEPAEDEYQPLFGKGDQISKEDEYE